MGAREMHDSVLYKLNVAREIAGIPFVLRSAIRCPDHNRAVGGKPGSAHLTGHAVDVACAGDDDRAIMLRAFVLAGFHRIGIASGFIHVDTSPHLPAPRIWLYS